MRRSPASLVTLALLLGACVVRAQHCAKCAAAAVSNVSYCELLANENVKNSSCRSVSINGRAATVTLVWGSEPAHAAAALLGALLRHVRRYSDVLLPRAPHPHATAKLAKNSTYNPTGQYANLVIGMSTAWEPEPPQRWEQRFGPSPGLAGPRLEDYGVSSVPARRRLFAWLKPTARELDFCWQHVRWAFYANQTALADCGFVGAANPRGNVTAVEVLGVGDCGTTLDLLHARANATEVRLYPRRVDRTYFVRTLQTANRSFLFLDYDMWKGAPGVRVVEPPPCVTVDATHDFECKQELDSAIAIRVADVETLKVYAPQLFQYVYDFEPSPESLRWILERQASGVDIEEAGCEWALKNKAYVVSKENRTAYDLYKYTVAVFVCSGDPNNEQYDKIIHLLGYLIYSQTFNTGCVIQIRRYYINCSNDYHMSNRLNDVLRTVGFYQLVGVVSMTVEGAAAASATATASRVPLLLADVVPDAGSGAAATWRVAGRPRHIARALRHFVRASGWTRVAVLSQPTRLATDYNAALKDSGGEEADIILRNFQIPLDLTEQDAQEVLQNLQATNARIVFVNADSQAAHVILTAAGSSGMGYTDGFVWILRDWRQKNVTCATKHFTVSFCVQGVEGSPAADGRAELHKDLTITLERPWPPLTVSLANALLTLSIGFKDVFRRFPNRRRDLHTAQMIRSLQESLNETPVTGVSHRLHYKERSLEETFVFVDQWNGSKLIKRLATWRVNATSGAVRGENEEHADYSRPDDLTHGDGASGCVVPTGDEFDPTCRDAECFCVLLLLVLAPGAVLLARRALRRRLARLQQEQQIQAIARRQHVATVLAAYLVERAALELYEELGAGRFGSVRQARLCKPGRTPRYVAAKALLDNAAPAEESEFLREACMIATLDHAHIVRLVGVCIADGPPLVLMELAFFGDLLGYLRARRHLVEDAAAESAEAEHVSAAALTRLAREAAQALQYLGARGVVHRDVCAANCLVDVRRSLKLADFGLARDTVAGADGAPEYSCRRRGLFPVPRMAPESILHGVFSAASDVWALGLLVLELVTLGARPYGTMSLPLVLQYVAAGGSPPLPLDATPQTRGLARLCWAREASQRPSAAQVAAYLAAWPLALRPALLSERDQPADADSGFAESPSTELLPPGSPFNSLEQFEGLAATH